jgi:ribonuclease HII
MIIIGIDEVGRGCWAGPLVAAAVAIDESSEPILGLDDSKKLSRPRRETLDGVIRMRASYGLGWVWPDEIDRSGLTAAVTSAMTAALSQVLLSLRDVGDIDVVVDGSYNFLRHFIIPDTNANRLLIRTQIGADGSIPAVGAASIIAKVARDGYMIKQAHASFPEYGFDRHVGYGTAAHIRAIAGHGVTELHRKSYKPVQKFLSSAG